MKRLLRRRMVAAYAVVVVAAGTGLFFWTRHGAAAVQYRTVAATLGTVTQTVSLSGNLAPNGESDLDFGGAGKVTAVNVQPGQTVAAGEVMATQDTTSLAAALSSAQATLSSAQAKLSLDAAGPTASSLTSAEGQVSSAQVQLQNAEISLTDTEAVNAAAVQQATTTKNTDCGSDPSGSQCAADTANLQNLQAKAQQSDDQAQGQVNTDRVQMQNAQASLAALKTSTTSQQIQMDNSQVTIDQVTVANAQAALSEATMTASVAGVIEQVNITTGEVVSSAGTGGSSGSSSSASATHALVIITPGVFQVTGSVSDAQVNEIAIGQQATVLAAGSSDAVSGKVTEVAEQATVSSGVATFPVTVVLSGVDPALRAGMSASVNVIVNQVVEVITVPTSAVHTTGTASTVTVLVNGQAQTVVVTVGASDSTRTQILSGINVGDQIVIATVSSTVPSSTTGNGLFGGGGRGGLGGGGGGISGGRGG